MRVLLISPPHVEASNPSLALASLSALARQKGHEVRVLDANIKSFHWLLSPHRLETRIQSIKEKFDHLNRKDRLEGEDMFHYDLLARALLTYPSCHERIADAAAICRGDSASSNVSRFFQALKVISSAFTIISASTYPTTISFYKLSLPYGYYHPGELLKAAADETHNLYIPFFKSEILPLVQEYQPDVVGLSVVMNNQVIPAVTLARLIKEAGPRVKCVVGGHYFSRGSEVFQDYPEFFDTIDYQVRCDGETPFVKLLEALETGAGLAAVPNLVYKDEDNRVRINPDIMVENLDHLPTPDFSDIDFNEYINLKPVIPLAPTRGCYWEKCAFCDSSIYQGEHSPLRYRERSVDLIIRDLVHLQEVHGTNLFFFCVNAMSPKILRRLSGAIIAKKLEVYWQCDIRLEKTFTPELCALMARAGCVNTAIGLESGCNRVLNKMEKGTDAKTAGQVLKNVHSSGIATHVMCFTGFPSETKEEGRMTVDFLRRNRPFISSVGMGAFILPKTSAVYKNMAKFGVQEISSHAEEPLIQFAPYKALAGRQPADIIDDLDEFKKEIHDAYNDFLNNNEYGLGMNAISVACLAQHRLWRGCLEEIDAGEPPDPAAQTRQFSGSDRIMLNARLLSCGFPLEPIRDYYKTFLALKQKNTFQYRRPAQDYEAQLLEQHGGIA
jgi:radical SAM superfamily enzyme YgiQ (UPF0313 family)